MIINNYFLNKLDYIESMKIKKQLLIFLTANSIIIVTGGNIKGGSLLSSKKL